MWVCINKSAEVEHFMDVKNIIKEDLYNWSQKCI